MEPLEQTSDFPKRYIPWIPLLALGQVLVVFAIYASVLAPHAVRTQVVSSAVLQSASAPSSTN